MDGTSALDPFQPSVHPGYRTEMALVALTDNQQRHLDQGRLAPLLLLDLKAAFDMIHYDLLTQCLLDAEIPRSVLQ